jgi:uncharacterized protein (DUF1501 family)
METMQQPVRTSLNASRRGFLELGSLLLGGLGLSDLLALREASAAAGSPKANTSVILLWLQGGPSQFETYDPKPQAPVEIRGELGAIQTAVPGTQLCELLPKHAQIAKKFNLVRSLSHDVTDHPGAAWRFLTGRRPANISELVAKFPSLECIVAKERELQHPDMPAYVSNERHQSRRGAAYLGPKYDPFYVLADPNKTDFKVENLAIHPELTGRLEDRRTLLESLDRFRRELDRSGAMEAADRYDQLALNLITSEKARSAFDLGRESVATRERYGRTEWGQRMLLARRLVEAGCSFVTVELHPWDDHGDSGMIFDNMRKRLPVFDQALPALIEDVYQRGLDRQVMIIAAGEFGRTPQLSKRPFPGAKTGRDHWPAAMSLLVAGGGMETGQVIGETDSKGAIPRQRPLDPNDFLATVYHFLGIDVNRTYPDLRGRPMPILPFGQPITELLSSRR